MTAGGSIAKVKAELMSLKRAISVIQVSLMNCVVLALSNCNISLMGSSPYVSLWKERISKRGESR